MALAGKVVLVTGAASEWNAQHLPGGVDAFVCPGDVVPA
jgi:hypothetical protein